MADTITTDQIGDGDNRTYGADIGPTGGQDMWAYTPLAGTFPPMERNASPAGFTGGTGGMAEPPPPGGDRYERRGF
jgi:hypothetical protein